MSDGKPAQELEAEVREVAAPEVGEDGAPQERYEQTPRLEGELSDEQLRDLQQQAAKLVKKREDLAGAFVAMTQSFRLHNTATISVMSVLQEERADPMLGLFFQQAAKNQAKRPFTREELAAVLGKGILPWLLNEIAKEKHHESLDETKANRAAEEQRRARPLRWASVALPVADWLQGDLTAMSRGRTLTLAGSREDVRRVAKSLATTAMDDARVLHCHYGLPSVETEEERLYILGKSKWLNAGESDRALIESMHEAMIKLNEVDLIVVDDMDDFSGSLSQLPPAARAVSGHRRLRKVADAVGCGLIIGVPVDTEHPFDLKSSGWSNLMTHSYIHFVTPGADGSPA